MSDRVPSPGARPDPDDRVIHTGFAALDAILGPGGLPRSASVAIRGDGSSGRTTLVLRLAAEAQATGSIVAWLDLSRSFDPVEAVARGIRLEWLVVITPETLDEGLAIGGALLAGRSVDLLVLDLPGGRLAATDKPARIADRLGRLAALARRSETLFVVLEPPGSRRWPRDRRRRVDRPPPRARPAVVDPARTRHRRPADGGAGRPQPLRPAGEAGDPPDPLRGGRRARRLSRPRRPPPRRGPRSSPRDRRTDPPRCDSSTSTGRTSPSNSPGREPVEPFPTGPLVLGGRPWDPGPVIDANPDARALGVRRGMPLGSAHRLVPEATFIDPDPDADRATVEAAFETLAAFSPGIAGSADPLDAAFGLFEVQVDGLEPLWGPEPVLVGRLVEALGTALGGGGGIRAGIAGTRFSATVAAVLARPGAPNLVPPGGEADFLAPHPSGLLTPDPDVRARLTRFGLRRIGAVAELDRTALVARFGEEGARIHARARGEELEPFRPRRAPERLRLGLPIEPAVEDLEPLRFVLHRLAAALTDQLVARGLAAVAGPAAPRPRPGLRPGRDAPRAGRRAALPRTDRRRRGDRAPPVRPARTDPATGRGRAARARTGRHGPGGRSAAPVVHATGRPRRPARVAAGPARPDVRGGSGPAGGGHRPGGATPRARWAWRPVVAGDRGVAP